MTGIFKKMSRITASLMIVLFGFNMLCMPVSYAQVPFLPMAGTMVSMTPKYNPLIIKGMKLYPDNPFKFDFIVDVGDTHLNQDALKDESQKLITYFLASLTTPEKEMWVNLSPYEKDRIIPKTFGETEMGKELLAQDYLLKQIMATALYPERQLGHEFWEKVYAQAQERFGTTNVPVSTFNKVWILPDKAEVYENSQSNSVFVVQSTLKVMLEQDYLALKKNINVPQNGVSALGSQVIREIVIPALEKEVNEGKNFAPLRQVYQSLILAAWYKKNLKDNIIAKAYIDRDKIRGVDVTDKNITQEIYKQYLRAYRKGVYNYIKEEIDPATQSIVPRKYFSGGVVFKVAPALTSTTNPAMASPLFSIVPHLVRLGVVLGFSGQEQKTPEPQGPKISELIARAKEAEKLNQRFAEFQGVMQVYLGQKLSDIANMNEAGIPAVDLLRIKQGFEGTPSEIKKAYGKYETGRSTESEFFGELKRIMNAGVSLENELNAMKVGLGVPVTTAQPSVLASMMGKVIGDAVSAPAAVVPQPQSPTPPMPQVSTGPVLTGESDTMTLPPIRLDSVESAADQIRRATEELARGLESYGPAAVEQNTVVPEVAPQEIALVSLQGGKNLSDAITAQIEENLSNALGLPVVQEGMPAGFETEGPIGALDSLGVELANDNKKPTAVPALAPREAEMARLIEGAVLNPPSQADLDKAKGKVIIAIRNYEIVAQALQHDQNMRQSSVSHLTLAEEVFLNHWMEEAAKYEALRASSDSNEAIPALVINPEEALASAREAWEQARAGNDTVKAGKLLASYRQLLKTEYSKDLTHEIITMHRLLQESFSPDDADSLFIQFWAGILQRQEALAVSIRAAYSNQNVELPANPFERIFNNYATSYANDPKFLGAVRKKISNITGKPVSQLQTNLNVRMPRIDLDSLGIAVGVSSLVHLPSAEEFEAFRSESLDKIGQGLALANGLPSTRSSEHVQAFKKTLAALETYIKDISRDKYIDNVTQELIDANQAREAGKISGDEFQSLKEKDGFDAYRNNIGDYLDKVISFLKKNQAPAVVGKVPFGLTILGLPGIEPANDFNSRPARFPRISAYAAAIPALVYAASAAFLDQQSLDQHVVKDFRVLSSPETVEQMVLPSQVSMFKAWLGGKVLPVVINFPLWMKNGMKAHPRISKMATVAVLAVGLGIAAGSLINLAPAASPSSPASVEKSFDLRAALNNYHMYDLHVKSVMSQLGPGSDVEYGGKYFIDGQFTDKFRLLEKSLADEGFILDGKLIKTDRLEGSDLLRSFLPFTDFRAKKEVLFVMIGGYEKLIAAEKAVANQRTAVPPLSLASVDYTNDLYAALKQKIHPEIINPVMEQLQRYHYFEHGKFNGEKIDQLTSSEIPRDFLPEAGISPHLRKDIVEPIVIRLYKLQKAAEEAVAANQKITVSPNVPPFELSTGPVTNEEARAREAAHGILGALGRPVSTAVAGVRAPAIPAPTVAVKYVPMDGEGIISNTQRANLLMGKDGSWGYAVKLIQAGRIGVHRGQYSLRLHLKDGMATIKGHYFPGDQIIILGEKAPVNKAIPAPVRAGKSSATPTHPLVEHHHQERPAKVPSRRRPEMEIKSSIPNQNQNNILGVFERLFGIPTPAVKPSHNSTKPGITKGGINYSNPAMIVTTKGGIDLEKVNLNTLGGGVRTAFSDPAQLQLLLNADGLEGVIYDIQPMTVPMMNKLLGFNINGTIVA